MAIDNPTETIRDLVRDEDFDAFGAALQVGSLASPFLKVINVLIGILNSNKKAERVGVAIRAMCDEFDRVIASAANPWRSSLRAIGLREPWSSWRKKRHVLRTKIMHASSPDLQPMAVSQTGRTRIGKKTSRVISTIWPDWEPTIFSC